MIAHAFLLAFTLCSGVATGLDACEEGEIRARSCAAAEAFVRAGMRAGQVLHVVHCGAA
jgi:hypothetical protein